MAKTFHLTIAKVGENLFDGDATAVSLPGVEGVFEVLANHEAYVSQLREGTVQITNAEGTKSSVAITGGIAEISNNQATVLL